MQIETDIQRYRRALAIDPDGSDLLQAMARQSAQHEEILRAYIYAKSRLDEEQVMAKFAMNDEVRKLRSSNKKSTITELRAIAETDQEQLARGIRIRKLQLEVDEWKSLRESSRMRSLMLSNMVELRLRGLPMQSTPAAAGARERAAYLDEREQMAAERRARTRKAQRVNINDNQET